MEASRSLIAVALGGAVGASLRYCLGLIHTKWEFPVMTFLVNVMGAILIGIIVELSSELLKYYPNKVLFLKTGLCGGLTTFSTFSLEAVTMIEKDHYMAAGGYVASSLVCCLIGVMIGRALCRGVISVLA